MKPALITAALALAAAMPAQAEIPGPVPAEYIRAYDGDTVTVEAAVWPSVAVETSVRVEGVDTAEIRADCPAEKRRAIEARDFVRELLSGADRIVLRDVREGKFAGRVVAKLIVDGRDLADVLIERGMGRVYDGGKREGWCDG